eukprot:TRINITY_DN611_c0_g1_i2.p1 TRINITY_DN611_c0_g1~~TRINITY_DN611_c0_g1_i2.p1  ORF type:complete len:120 (+),score=40.48 TRINITY_DN611_c0_g1_i2:455-814(+)
MADKNNAGASGPQAIDIPQSTPIDLNSLCVTPGGVHMFGTTPGGTKIFYDRSTLMALKNSPLSKTPPVHKLPNIPGVTTPLDPEERKRLEEAAEKAGESSDDEEEKAPPREDDGMFQMD